MVETNETKVEIIKGLSDYSGAFGKSYVVSITGPSKDFVPMELITNPEWAKGTFGEDYKDRTLQLVALHLDGGDDEVWDALEERLKEVGVTTKVCRVCGEELPLGDFHRHKSRKDGYRNICKSCRRMRALVLKSKISQLKDSGWDGYCLYCGLEKAGRQNTFCSRRCATLYQIGDGSGHPGWLGDSVGVAGVHNWVHRHYEKPETCEMCGVHPGLAVDGRTKLHWANKSGNYLRERSDWMALCIPCHWRYDEPWLKRRRDGKR